VYTVAAGTKEGGSHNDEVCRSGQARGVKGKDEDWRACEETADVLANKFCSRNEGSGAAEKEVSASRRRWVDCGPANASRHGMCSPELRDLGAVDQVPCRMGLEACSRG